MVCDGCSTRLKPTFPEYARRVSNILAQAPKEAGAVVMVRRHDNGQLQFVPAERAAEFGVPVEEKKEAPPVATKVCPTFGTLAHGHDYTCACQGTGRIPVNAKQPCPNAGKFLHGTGCEHCHGSGEVEATGERT
jgi:hypothetical protein